MRLIENLISTLQPGRIVEVRIGLRWTAVVAECGGAPRCGLAATLGARHEHSREPEIPHAGRLEKMPGLELTALLKSENGLQRSVGMATVNALLPPPQAFSERNAEAVIAEHGGDKRVVVVGSFPFISRLRPLVGELIVLERCPAPGEHPADSAPRFIPDAGVVAITGMALVNHTLEDLLRLCSRQAIVLVLGPSTPLSPVLFDYGVDLISGSLVTDIPAVLRCLGQGGNFRQVHQAGVRLVTMERQPAA